MNANDWDVLQETAERQTCTSRRPANSYSLTSEPLDGTLKKHLLFCSLILNDTCCCALSGYCNASDFPNKDLCQSRICILPQRPSGLSLMWTACAARPLHTDGSAVLHLLDSFCPPACVRACVTRQLLKQAVGIENCGKWASSALGSRTSFPYRHLGGQSEKANWNPRKLRCPKGFHYEERDSQALRRR